MKYKIAAKQTEKEISHQDIQGNMPYNIQQNTKEEMEEDTPKIPKDELMKDTYSINNLKDSIKWKLKRWLLRARKKLREACTLRFSHSPSLHFYIYSCSCAYIWNYLIVIILFQSL